jgi:preprotein translocase subunit SecY
MAALNAVGQINLISGLAGAQIIPNFNLFNASSALTSWTIVISMTAGTMFAIWLGELISEYGVRNQGLSMIIFAGIISRIPSTIQAVLADEQNRLVGIILLVVFTVLVAGHVPGPPCWKPNVHAG